MKKLFFLTLIVGLILGCATTYSTKLPESNISNSNNLIAPQFESEPMVIFGLVELIANEKYSSVKINKEDKTLSFIDRNLVMGDVKLNTRILFKDEKTFIIIEGHPHGFNQTLLGSRVKEAITTLLKKIQEQAKIKDIK